MFKNLRERLRIFKKEAADKLVDEEGPAPVPVAPETPKTQAPGPLKKKGKKKRRTEEEIRKDIRVRTGLPTEEQVQAKKKVKLVKRSEREKEIFADGVMGRKIADEKLNGILDELEMILLESDVALPVVERIKRVVRKDLKGRRVKFGVDIGEVIEDSLRRAVRKVLITQTPINFDNYIDGAEKPIVLMFVGINGTGKTTAIARIAHRLLRKGHTCVLAAGDTFRAGAIEQLTKHSINLGVKIIKHQAGSDPAAVAFDAIEHAKARHKDVVLLDTAGRMQTNINLMAEMTKIKRIAKPDMIIFVGDALAGNDAVQQAKSFDEIVGIDAAILTKIDADAKGGAALSIAYAVGKPILFVGIGQDYPDLARFNSKWMVERLFGPQEGR